MAQGQAAAAVENGGENKVQGQEIGPFIADDFSHAQGLEEFFDGFGGQDPPQVAVGGRGMGDDADVGG